MKYVKGQDVLPVEVLKIIQEYVDGGYLYIPRKDENAKSWGEMSGAKDALSERNRQIFKEYCSGAKITELAPRYYLSEQSIRRVIGEQKRLFSSSIQNQT